MKSGLWILIVVVIAGVFVGWVLKDRMKPPKPADEQAAYKEVSDLTDPEARIDKLQTFISDFPKSSLKASAYSQIAKEMLTSLKDTTRFVGFARAAIEKETDPESKATMYYRLYSLKADTKPEEAALIGTELLKVPINASWVYNYIGYDLAERARDIDLALSLCQKAVELATTREDSAASLDSRGFAYYQKGMYKEALPDFEESVKLYGEPYEDVLRHLANAYLRAGESDKAFKGFRDILLSGEYEYARATLDSMMISQRYSPRQKKNFEDKLWQDRLAAAKPAIAFTMPTLQGTSFSFEPAKGDIVLLNFMSPT